MEIAFSIIFIGLLVFLAYFFAWLFGFLRIPDVLMLISIGILIGPILNLVHPTFLGEAGNIIIMLILVMILFEGATKLKIQSLKNAILGTLSLSLISFLLTMAGIGLLLWKLTGLPLISSFLIGSIVGGNAAAVVVPLIEKIKIKDESKTTLFLESGLTDVLSIVFTLAFVASFEIGELYIDSVVFSIVNNLLMAIIIGGIFALIWSLFLNKIHDIKNSSFATLAFVFIVYGITESFGFSGLISIIIFGIVLGNVPLMISSLKKRHKFFYTVFHPQPLSGKETSFFCEIVFLIKIFFFVFIGTSLNFANFSVLALGLLLTIFIFAIRIPAVLLSLPKVTPKFDTSIVSVTVPRGLAAAVLALIPLQKGLEGGQLIQDITYSIVFFSIFLTSVMIFLVYNTKVRKLYEFIFASFSSNPKDGSLEYPDEEK
jgi:potassium/hydrogen antiporter